MIDDITYVQIGPHTLYCGDSYKIMAELSLFGQDAALCMDPPYVIATSGGGEYRKTRSTMQDIEENDLHKGFDISIINPLIFNSVVTFCHNDQLAEILHYLSGNYKRYCVLSWHKTNPQPVHNNHYQPDTEFIVHAWNKASAPIGQLKDKKRWMLENTLRKKPELSNHPTVKPDPVMNKVITNINANTIVDPFMGTGSTGVAAVKQGRKFIGIEKNSKYFEVACRRISEAVNA